MSFDANSDYFSRVAPFDEAGRRQSDRLHERVQAFALASLQDLPQAKAVAPPGARVGTPHDTFESLALDIARYQAKYIPGFARLVDAASGGLACVGDIPAVPVDAFRMTRIAAHPSDQDELTFLTSGTTSGLRGGHHFRRTDTYRTVSLLWGRKALLPIGTANVKVASIAPHPGLRPTSSLGFMMQAFAQTWDPDAARTQEDAWLLRDERIDLPGIEQAVGHAWSEQRPLLVLATSFALVFLLDELGGRRIELPSGSVVMQTGGFKGKSRQIEASQLRNWVASAFAIPESQVISEYGMTELSSQLYEGTLPAGALVAEPGWLVPPPWLRVQALEPDARSPLPDGEVGLASFTDLANIDSAVRIVTMDQVVVRGGLVQLLGRQSGAPPRGCSLAIEELLGEAESKPNRK